MKYILPLLFLTSCTNNFRESFYKLHKECSETINPIKDMTPELNAWGLKGLPRWDASSHMYSHLILTCMEKKYNER